MARSGYLKDPPDGGWGWTIVIGGLYCLAMFGGGMRCYSVFFEPLMVEFQVEYGRVAWLNGMFQVAYGIFAVLGSATIKKIGCRETSLVASVVCGLSCFVASFCADLLTIQIFMGLIVGACVGLVSVSVFATVSRYFKSRLHTANQLLCLGMSAGPLVICPGYQCLTSLYGWRGASRIASGLFLNMAVASALLRPIKLQSDVDDEEFCSGKKQLVFTRNKRAKPEPNTIDVISTDEKSTGSQTNDRRTPVRDSNENITLPPRENGTHSTLQTSENAPYESRKRMSVCDRLVTFCNLMLFADKRFYLYTFSWTCFGCAFFSASIYIIPYGEKELGLSEFEASTLVSAFAGGSLFARVVYAMFFDRMPVKLRILYVCFVFGTFSVFMLVLPFIPGYVGAMICCVYIGTLGGGSDGIFNAFIAEIFSAHQVPFVFSYANMITHASGTVATVLVGTIVDRIGSLKVPFFIGSGFAALSSFLVFVLHQKTLSTRMKKLREN